MLSVCFAGFLSGGFHMLDSGMQLGRKKADKIYNWLRAYIDENKFSSNQKLPSENELCRRLDGAARRCAPP